MEFDRIEDIIDFAVAKEQEAVDFYTDLADKVHSDDIVEELRDMADMEQRHKDWLMENSVALASSDAPSVTNLKLAEYVVETTPGPNMTWHDVVNVAMHREEAAVNLYNSLAHLVTDPTIKQTFRNLAAEEARHKLYFETVWDNEVLIEN